MVTRPFGWEGKVRGGIAEAGIDALRKEVDALIVIPNDGLIKFMDKRISLDEAFRTADDVLRLGVQGIAGLMINSGTTSLRFVDVKRLMADTGEWRLGIGFGTGDSRTEDAATQAMTSPLLGGSIDGA